MTIAATLLPEFDHEMKSTRALLALIPASRADWRPHAKSFNLGELGVHIVNILRWAEGILAMDAFDMNPPGGLTPPAPFTEAPELVSRFDAGVQRVRNQIAETADDRMAAIWTLASAGNTIMQLPRAAALRTVVMNHLIHHRGQLTVYLRLCDVPLPATYARSADT